jgi:type II secretory ATPase GspE/PulE/Tfp pilus assembly ATPase PilB-like protein
MAQRLIRRVCPACATRYTLTKKQIAELGLDATEHSGLSAMRAEGCADCRHTGYRGRNGLFELLIVHHSVRDNIQARANATDIRDDAVRQGMRLLRDDGVDQILAGVTTAEEVLRVTMRATL